MKKVYRRCISIILLLAILLTSSAQSINAAKKRDSNNKEYKSKETVTTKEDESEGTLETNQDIAEEQDKKDKSEAYILSRRINTDYFYRASHPQHGNSQGNADKMAIDNKIAYCIQPHLRNNNGDIYEDKVSASEYLQNEQLMNRLNYLMIKGYEKSEKTWWDALVTKLAIWTEIGWEVEYIEDRNEPGNMDKTEKLIEEIDKLRQAADHYLTEAKFTQTSLPVVCGKEYKIEDQNQVLNNYQIISTPEGIEAKINDNSLLIKINDHAEPGRIILEKDKLHEDESFVYTITNRQDLMTAGQLKNLQSFVDIEAVESRSQIKIISLDTDTKEIIPGTVFELARNKQFTNSIEVICDESGTATVTDLNTDDGDIVYIREKTIAERYILDPSIKKIQLIPGETTEVIFYNQIKTANLLIRKLDPELKGAGLPGVKFEIARDKDFTQAVMTGSSDPEGELLFSDLALLADETVYIREVETLPGYILDPKITEVELEPGKTTEISFNNSRKRPKIIFRKENKLTGQGIFGAEFELYAAENIYSPARRNQEKIQLYQDGDFVARASSDKDGKTCFDQTDSGDALPFAKYKLIESKAASGYAPDNKIYTIDLKDDADDVVIIKLSSQSLPTQFRLIKTNDKKEKLTSVGFTFYNEKKSLLKFTKDKNGYKFDPKGEISEIFTDDQGEIVINYLEEGVYFYQESSAPQNYSRDKSLHKFTINENTSSDKPLIEQMCNFRIPQTGESKNSTEFYAYAIIILAMTFIAFYYFRRKNNKINT